MDSKISIKKFTQDNVEVLRIAETKLKDSQVYDLYNEKESSYF